MRLASSVACALVALAACARGSHTVPEPIDRGSLPSEDEDAAAEAGHEGDEDALPETTAGTCDAPGGAALLAEVRRIVEHTRSSTYSHRTSVDEAAGRYDLDCSGLVDYALARVCPDALESVKVGRRKRPLAKHFVELVTTIQPGATQGHWTHVARAAELAPGDVVAWLKPADVVTSNTGHVMIVRGPVSVARGEATVPIFDSTSVRHGADDSRFPTKATGVGLGTIYLTLDAAGAPTGYRWSNSKKARKHSTVIALGRVE